MFARILAALALAPLLSTAAPAEVPALPTDGDQPTHGLANCKDWDDWDEPTPPFRIFGQTYYVGTCGIAVLLVNTPQGSIVIDGGPRGTGDLIAQNIETLGFDLKRVRLHLISHEHHDHVGGLAVLQRRTGAAVMTSDAAARALEAGTSEPDDPQYDLHQTFDPVQVTDTLIRPGYQTGNIIIGGLTLTPVSTPGHTPGAMSYHWQSCDEAGECKTLVYADSMTPVSADGYRYSDHPEYLAAFRRSIEKIAGLDCDILLTPHPSASNMIERLAGTAPLVDSAGCRKYADELRQKLDERLAKEAANAG